MNEKVLLSSCEEALNVLLSGERSALGKHFGVGLLVTKSDSVDDVLQKCENYLDRYDSYIKNIELVTENRELLEARIGNVKVNKILSKLSDADKAALKLALANC